MKKISWLFAAALPLALLFGCQKEVVTSNDEATDLRNPRLQVETPLCETACIDENSGSTYAETHITAPVTWGNPQNPNSKTLSVKVWNTLTDIVYEFTLAGDNGNLQYYDEGTATWTNAGALTNNVVYTVTRPLAANWQACDVVTEQWRAVGGGPQVSLGNVNYALIGECVTCVDELASDFSCDGSSVTFTFTATEAGPIVIQGGLTAGAVITSVSSSAALTQNTTHPATGGPSSVTRWEGNVEACTAVTVTINYTGGHGIGAWSAKRGDVVLGSTVAVSCP